MPTPLKCLLQDETGAALLEYALLAALVALVILTAAQTLGRNIASLYNWAPTAHRIF